MGILSGGGGGRARPPQRRYLSPHNEATDVFRASSGPDLGMSRSLYFGPSDPLGLRLRDGDLPATGPGTTSPTPSPPTPGPPPPILGLGTGDDLLSLGPDHRRPPLTRCPYLYLADTTSRGGRPSSRWNEGAGGVGGESHTLAESPRAWPGPESPEGRWLWPDRGRRRRGRRRGGSGSDRHAWAVLDVNRRPPHRRSDSHALAAWSGQTDPPSNWSTTTAARGPCDYPTHRLLGLLTENDAPALSFSRNSRKYRRSYQSTYKTRWWLSRRT